MKVHLFDKMTRGNLETAYIVSQKLKENKKSSKFYRIINEIPTVLLIFIVFIVVFKPI